MNTFGITIMPEYIQSEGIDAVLNRLEKAAIKQVGTSPYYMIQTEEGVGQREPPIDGGSGKVRLLDRPLWGKNELWFRVIPSFVPNLELYKGLRYQPPVCEEKPENLLNDFILAAAKRDIKVYFQIMAAIPPALRVQDGGPVDEDLSLLPNGSRLQNPLSKNGSLASAEILAYTKALTQDLLEQHPGLAGIRFDWPEYPCYHIDTIFTDFNPQVEAIAIAKGYNYIALKKAVGELYEKLHNLTDADLSSASLFELNGESQEVRDWLELKRSLVTDYNRELCKTVQSFGKEAVLHAFPPPFSDITGFDFEANNQHADGIGMKLYTMHLPMILNNYGRQLLEWNPELNEQLLVTALNRWLDLADEALDCLADYAYPTPEMAHQISSSAQIRKIKEATSKSPKTHTIAHSYGPVEDYGVRLNLSLENTPDGIWLNRYAYLDDQKYNLTTNCLAELNSLSL
jgi:hypothetical protein